MAFFIGCCFLSRVGQNWHKGFPGKWDQCFFLKRTKDSILFSPGISQTDCGVFCWPFTSKDRQLRTSQKIPWEKAERSDRHKIFHRRDPRGLTVRKYHTGETQELAPTTLKVRFKYEKFKLNPWIKSLKEMQYFRSTSLFSFLQKSQSQSLSWT